MRELTVLKDQQQAQRLIAFLAVQAVETTCDQDDGVWTIWIHNDDDRDKAADILADFEANPNDVRYENAERKVRHVLLEADRLQQEKVRQAELLKKRRSGSWWHCYPATYVMIGMCVLVVVFCTNRQEAFDAGLGANLCNDTQSRLRQQMSVVSPIRTVTEEDGTVAQYFQLSPKLNTDDLTTVAIWTTIKAKAIFTATSLARTVAKGEIWRPIAPIFLHMSLMHILFNMMAFRSFGCVIEFVRGTPRFVWLCVVLAVVSNIGELFWSGPFFGGMSGVIFGLVGYVWIKGKTQPQLGLALPQQTLVFCLLWLVLCMVGVFGAIANAAHLVGFLAGIAIGGRQAVWKKLPFGRS